MPAQLSNLPAELVLRIAELMLEEDDTNSDEAVEDELPHRIVELDQKKFPGNYAYDYHDEALKQRLLHEHYQATPFTGAKSTTEQDLRSLSRTCSHLYVILVLYTFRSIILRNTEASAHAIECLSNTDKAAFVETLHVVCHVSMVSIRVLLTFVDYFMTSSTVKNGN